MSQRHGLPYTYPTRPGRLGESLKVKLHRDVAEQALGHVLPPKAVVHHVNEDENDFRNCNLVICQDEGYHKLLHQRTRAYRACGHADWRMCTRCKQYAPVSELHIYVQKSTGYEKAPIHPACNALSIAESRRKVLRG